MSTKADDGDVRPKRAPGRPWQARQRPEVLTDPVLGTWEGATLVAIHKLPPGELVALTLASAGLKPHEIADLLGLSVDTANQRLFRARRRVREELGEMEGGAGALALLGLLPHRLRALAGRLLRLGEHVAAPQGPALTALAPLVACAVLGSAASAPTSAPSLGPQLITTAEAASVDLASSASAPTALPFQHQATPPMAIATSSKPMDSSTGTAAGHQLLPLVPSETPEDTDVTAITASPHYDHDHTIVALGLGHACNCPVLLRSTDGGASWQTTLVAVAGAQVMLPPNYPVDGRIFIGQIPGAPRSDWVSSGWGQPFQPLTLPPGWLAMAGSRLLSASATAVWSLDDGVLTPVATYQGLGSAALASTADAAYVMVPAHAATITGVVTTSPTLLTCAQGGCQVVGAVPLPDVGLLAVSGSTVVASSDGRVVVSRDSGSTFEDVTPPSVTATTVTAALGASPGALWSVVQGSTATVLRRDSGGWHALVHDGVKSLAVLSDQRVIALLGNGGLLCTANGGTSWAARCPAASAQ